jgi:hypothetical protein
MVVPATGIRDVVSSYIFFNFNFKFCFFFFFFFFWELRANVKVKGKIVAFGWTGKRDRTQETRINGAPLKAKMKDVKVIEPNWFTPTISCRATNTTHEHVFKLN